MQLEANEISAGYGAANVLHGVSLTLAAGEFVGLVGPNGCGKSTLLRVLSHVLRPRCGRVLLNGQESGRIPAGQRARQMAFVPQQETAAFDFTVRDIVLMGRYPYRERWHGESAKDYEIVAAALAEADLTHLADRPVTRLSGGEHRRVLLARALAQQTPLLLLDEPTAHLDVTHQVELMRLVQSLTRTQNKGALAALHDLNQAAEFCDRLILMRDGKIIAGGTPDAVLTPDHLRDVYAAEFEIGRNAVTGRPLILAITPSRVPLSAAQTVSAE